MIKGQKGVCFNDASADFTKAIYTQLPVRGRTNTIREVFLVREKIVSGSGTATVALSLVELNNAPDPLHAGRAELGFSSERFASLEELPREAAAEENTTGAGSYRDFWAS